MIGVRKINTIGQRLKYIRENLMFVDQFFLADFFKMTRSTISSIETGRTSPSLSIVLTLAHYFLINPSWILMGKGDMPLLPDDTSEYLRGGISFEQLNISRSATDRIISELPRRIKRVRNFRKISQKELAFNIGVSQSNVSGIENGLIQPTVDITIRISELLDVDLDALLSNDFNAYFFYSGKLGQLEEPEMVNELQSEKVAILDTQGLTETQLEILQSIINEFKAQGRVVRSNKS